MITKSQAKRKQDIKTKLMAAIAMLLVSSIMMVSSTYAWFTLSTAPEVTGIQTAVGANGNLEMALLPSRNLGDIKSEAGDGQKKDIAAKNITWGNLVDLSIPESGTSIYGLERITLFPSALNAASSDANGNPTALATAMLKTPNYGADGRVSALAENTITGKYNSTSTSFMPDDSALGVRAVGVASGMTDRQLDYRNASSAANTAAAAAKTKASQSLNTNGSALANIAIEYGMGADTASFDKNDVAALRAIINDLNGADGAFKKIENAYIQYILAYAASAQSGAEDTVWQAVKGAVNQDGATLTSVITALGGESALPEALKTAISNYYGAVAQIAVADSKLQPLETELATDPAATFDWTEIRDAMTPLANPAKIKVNDILASDVKENLGALVSSVTSQNGLRVIMETGAGVYADIADQCGDYKASITIESVEYGGIVLNNMTARMETKSTVQTPYLNAIGAVVIGAGMPGDGAVGTMPITDMYGYIIDLAFRTNAADSKLKLQVAAADRIYSGNTNEQTMGHGSYMTFAATTPDFSNDQIKELMKAIRIVFFDPLNSNTVIATGKLDADNAALEADGIKANIYLYELSNGTGESYNVHSGEIVESETYYLEQKNYKEEENPAGAEATTTLYTRTGDEGNYTFTPTTYDPEATGATYYVEIDPTYNPAVDAAAEKAAGKTLYVKVAANAGENKKADDVIMPLTQNQAHSLSVLVYLDGNLVGNDDVAATAATSMTGTMNLQFASTATLVPMEYADLHTPAGN